MHLFAVVDLIYGKDLADGAPGAHWFANASQRTRFQPWRYKDGEHMMDFVGIMYWTGHSMRHFIPTVAAAIDIGKEARSRGTMLGVV